MRVLPVLVATLLLAASSSGWAEESRSSRMRVESGSSRAAPPARQSKPSGPSGARRTIERARTVSPTTRAVSPATKGIVEMRDPIGSGSARVERSPRRDGTPVLAVDPVIGRDAANGRPGRGGGCRRRSRHGCRCRYLCRRTGQTGALARRPGRSGAPYRDARGRTLARVRAEAQALPQSAYRRPDDIAKHRALLTRVDGAARMVEQRAADLPARDLALSRYYLSQASAAAQSLNAQAQQAQSIGNEQLSRLERATQPVQTMRERMARGQTPFERRQVTVTVRDAQGRHLPHPLRVYVLPAGLVDSPPDEPELIRELLSELSFERLTSLPPGRCWKATWGLGRPRFPVRGDGPAGDAGAAQALRAGTRPPNRRARSQPAVRGAGQHHGAVSASGSCGPCEIARTPQPAWPTAPHRRPSQA